MCQKGALDSWDLSKGAKRVTEFDKNDVIFPGRSSYLSNTVAIAV